MKARLVYCIDFNSRSGSNCLSFGFISEWRTLWDCRVKLFPIRFLYCAREASVSWSSGSHTSHSSMSRSPYPASARWGLPQMQLQIPFVILELRIVVAVSAWHLARSYLRVLCVAHIKNQGRVHCRHGILRPISTLHTSSQNNICSPSIRPYLKSNEFSSSDSQHAEMIEQQNISAPRYSPESTPSLPP